MTRVSSARTGMVVSMLMLLIGARSGPLEAATAGEPAERAEPVRDEAGAPDATPAHGETRAAVADTHATAATVAGDSAGASPPPFSVAPRVGGLASTRRVPGLLSRRRLSFHAGVGLAVPAPTSVPAASALGLTLRPPPRPLTRTERLVYSADRGAYTGLALGTLGSWTGLWEEETAWYLMGAGAALGAIWGGIGNDDVQIRVQPRVGAEERPR